MLMAIEETFGFKIEDEEAKKLVTVGDLYDLVTRSWNTKRNLIRSGH